MNIDLTAEQEQFIYEQINQGRYDNAEQMITEALQLLAKNLRQPERIQIEQIRQRITPKIEQPMPNQVTNSDLVFARLQEKIRTISEAQSSKL